MVFIKINREKIKFEEVLLGRLVIQTVSLQQEKGIEDVLLEPVPLIPLKNLSAENSLSTLTCVTGMVHRSRVPQDSPR